MCLLCFAIVQFVFMNINSFFFVNKYFSETFLKSLKLEPISNIA
jgi:hypothetical protein